MGTADHPTLLMRTHVSPLHHGSVKEVRLDPFYRAPACPRASYSCHSQLPTCFKERKGGKGVSSGEQRKDGETRRVRG